MAKETIATVVAGARTKANLLARSPLQYLVLSALAGAYVGFGIILILSIGAPLAAAGSPAVKVVMGASFGVALALVIFAGSELFTGNNMVMTIGSLAREVSWGQTLGVWAASWAGNLAGSLLLALVAVKTGLVGKAPFKDFLATAALAKMNAPFGELFYRGLLCNVLVCLAVWTALRAKDDMAKLAMIFWCLFAFIGAGFEHSVANMTLLGMSLLAPHGAGLTWGGFVHNLVPVTLGNIVGGAVVIGASYYFVAAGENRLEAGEEVAGRSAERFREVA
ncbi:MAG TPA: formate/nitrite transporter family protein [Polyangia bacterium]|nr:formate/nitrite transporter family protein [Polyangia bacterium]